LLTVPLVQIGCFKVEDLFGGRKYIGGASGANIGLAHEFAIASGKKYFAIASAGKDGHAFAFDTLGASDGDNAPESRKCGLPCIDSSERSCGCSDALCGGVAAEPGQNHVRR
jgi:hypothetical protein